MKKILFISTHFDDAIFSCGQIINKFTESGVICDVLTVFGKEYLGCKNDFINRIHRGWGFNDNDNVVFKRKIEDKEAVKSVGANQIVLSFLDCIYRKNNGQFIIKEKRDLFVAKTNEITLIDEIESTIKKVIFKNGYSEVYLPLGVGTHIDHQVVSKLKLDNTNINVFYYADFPYSLYNYEEFAKKTKNMIKTSYKVSSLDYDRYLASMKKYNSQYSKNWTLDEHEICNRLDDFFISNSNANFSFWSKDL